MSRYEPRWSGCDGGAEAVLLQPHLHLVAEGLGNPLGIRRFDHALENRGHRLGGITASHQAVQHALLVAGVGGAEKGIHESVFRDGHCERVGLVMLLSFGHNRHSLGLVYI